MATNKQTINTAIKWALAEVDRCDPLGKRHWNLVGSPGLIGSPWCAAFVTCAYRRAGVDFTKLIQNPFWVSNFKTFGDAIGAWKTKNPSEGELVCYDWRDGDTQGDLILA